MTEPAIPVLKMPEACDEVTFDALRPGDVAVLTYTAFGVDVVATLTVARTEPNGVVYATGNDRGIKVKDTARIWIQPRPRPALPDAIGATIEAHTVHGVYFPVLALKAGRHNRGPAWFGMNREGWALEVDPADIARWRPVAVLADGDWIES